jgi:Domain of unknown function (DUF4111)
MGLEDRIGAAPAAYVREVAGRVRAVAGERLVGVWLLGSASLGDFAPRRSDLDVQAVTATRLPLADRERLAGTLQHDALPCPARGLEFVLYAREDLEAPHGPTFGLNLNTGARMAHHVALDPDEDPRFWFVIDLSIARQHAIGLIGPPARDVLPAPPEGLVRTALLEAMAWYAERGGSPAETLLSACRTWAWAVDGRWRSKGDSAGWARARLADPGPLDRALAARDGAGAAAVTRAEAAVVVEAARAALAAGQPKR